MKRLHYGRQKIDEDDIKAVVDVLRSEMITQGHVVNDFETAFAEYTGAKYAVACSSGSAALHLTYQAGGLTSGDVFIVSSNTFASTANAALHLGALPVFSDIDPDTYNMSEATLKNALSRVPKPLKVKCVTPVHFAGRPADMESLSALAKESGVSLIIEDACHALGARWKSADAVERRVGDCSFSDMTVFSFHPVKAITTGEGGMVTTNDKALYERLKLFRAHGITKNANDFVNLDKGSLPPKWYYEMIELGHNYRITDFQCALGISQLKKLDAFLEQRKRVAARYDLLFEASPFIVRRSTEGPFDSANHLYVIEIDFEEIGIDKAKWFEEISELGIHPQVHYIPVHLQPYYQKRFATKKGDLPNVESYYECAVSLPIYPGLTDEDLDFVASLVMESLKAAKAASGEIL